MDDAGPYNTSSLLFMVSVSASVSTSSLSSSASSSTSFSSINQKIDTNDDYEYAFAANNEVQVTNNLNNTYHSIGGVSGSNNINSFNGDGDSISPSGYNNYWALLALLLVLCTAAGNILVCLAIAWERRLQNVTNYFLMSLAITDLMVAVLVMPLGILTLVRGECIMIIKYIFTNTNSLQTNSVGI